MAENNFDKQALRSVKIEYAVKQKKGLPFLLASAVLWTVMLIAFLTNWELAAKNTIAMCCSALLMPLGMLFGKVLKVKIFDKSNPLSGLSVIAALNQLLYLPVVVWAMYAAPDKMIMVYAIVVDREGAQKYAKAFPETVRSVYLDTLPEFAETNLIRRDGKAKARERIKSDAQAGLFSTKGYDCILCNSEKMTIDGLAYQFMNYVEAMRRAFDMDHKEAV